jgi:hypothetical protein
MFFCRENQYRSNSNMVHRTCVKIHGVGADLPLVFGRTVVFSNCGARFFFHKANMRHPQLLHHCRLRTPVTASLVFSIQRCYCQISFLCQFTPIPWPVVRLFCQSNSTTDWLAILFVGFCPSQLPWIICQCSRLCLCSRRRNSYTVHISVILFPSSYRKTLF